MDLVVLAGLQGSGKTTFYRARFAETHAHVSKDLFRHDHDKARRQRHLVEAAAADGLSVVVDNTSVRREDRAELVTLARVLGMRPVLYWFPPDPGASLARNQRREGKARVPRVAVFATLKRLAPPVADEGFAEAYEVVAEGEGAFTVRPRPDLVAGASPPVPEPP
jgi:predicted kinase